MISRLFIAQLVALWISFCILVAITAVTTISFFHRADCDPENPLSLLVLSTDGNTSSQCSQNETLSRFVLRWSSYIQSTNIIVLQAIASLSLLTLRPYLLARSWKSLETDRPPLRAVQSSIMLVDSPQLIPGIMLGWHAGFFSSSVIFVIVVGLLSLGSPLAVSSIYRSHIGPFYAELNFTGGGGIGPMVPAMYDSSYVVGSGVTAGRSIIAAQSIDFIQAHATSPPGLTPFLLDSEVQQVWQARKRTVAALSTLDCGSSAPGRISQFPFSITSPEYWWSDSYDSQTTDFTLGGVESSMYNEPNLSVVYFNASTVVSPGVVETTTSVIFFAANGTIQGAQQHITSPNATSRIAHIDILVCTSIAKLQISDCDIAHGFVQNCSATNLTTISNITSSRMGGVDQYLDNPDIVGNALSAVPAVMVYPRTGFFPMFVSITETLNASGLPPTTYLTAHTYDPGYYITLDYISTAMFEVGIKGMVQGLLTAWTQYNTTEGSIEATFATSDVWLQMVILGVAFVCALVATFLSTLPSSSRHAVELTLARTLAISRDPKVDEVFAPYADRSVAIGGDVMEKKFAYGYDPRTGRWALRPVDDGTALTTSMEESTSPWHRPKQGPSIVHSEEEIFLLPITGENTSGPVA
ncbi:hypothetical protein JAAARDRAFT_73964 [Jaapia argillacea MUCL 33604]|uniref:Uncharacterized protein n=1 Tax=Jaapia argillacea MUCL 33604 TaxID=933084 RepID=A0A067P7J2_9AGAM|nr:hypothetical protein JAAARDRAFT_73964 [Jaapia argillacea MUCL 33604]